MGSEDEKAAPWGETFQDRFWWWRNRSVEVTLEEVAERVNRSLERPLAVSTISNYEARGQRRASEPRASFLKALGAAFPDLNVSWLVTGEGSPSLSSGESAKAAPSAPWDLTEAAWSIFVTGGPAVWPAFLRTVDRLRYSCPAPPDEHDPEEVAALAAALQSAVREPLDRVRENEEAISADALEEYYLSVLTAVMRVVPGAGEGSPLAETVARLQGETDG